MEANGREATADEGMPCRKKRSPRRPSSGRARSALRALRGRTTRDAAEDGARHEAGAAGIVVVEEAAHQLARGIEAADGPALTVEHAALGGDVQPAERERDTGRHRVAD